MSIFILLLWIIGAYLVIKIFTDTHEEEIQHPLVYASVVIGIIFMLPLFILILIIEFLLKDYYEKQKR